MPGFLETQSSTNQVEAIYVAYFGRAGDGPGFTYWTNFFGSQVGAGQPTAGTAITIADSFAVQPEALAKYSLLATPPNLTNPTSPVTIASVQSFINTVYQDLFNHAADATGLAFWQNAILTSKVSIGAAVYTIANGATGNDTTILTNKITAAVSFTTDTVSFNTPVNQTLLTAAEQAVAPVGLDPATVTTSQAFSMQFAQNSTQAQLTLTPGVDALVASAPGAIFNAPLVNAPIQIAGASFNIQTLTTNDTLKDSVGDGTLNATFNGTNGPAIVPNVTMSGIATANLVNIAAAVQGFEGNVTGLTTVNDSSSNAGITLGSPGAGLVTALKNVNVTGFSGGNGAALFTGIIAGSAGSASNTINLALSGQLGATNVVAGVGQADKLIFTTDGAPGTKTSPQLSYGTWALTVNSPANLQLQQGVGPSVGGATTLTLAGAGNVALGQDAAGDWGKLTTIDASKATGNVTITGFATTFGSNTAATAANPLGLFGSAAGLLNGNTSLTSYSLSGGAGVNTLDVSSFTTNAQLAALTTVAGTNTATTNEIIVTSLNADATTAATWANIKGFQILGDVGAGGDTGIINLANLPSSINDVLFQTAAVGALTINTLPAAFTVDTEANGGGFALTIGAVGPAAGTADSLTLIVGSSTAVGAVGAVTMTGEEVVTVTAQGPAGGVDLVGLMSLTPTVTGNEHVTIGGTEAITIGNASGAIQDINPGSTPASLFANNLTINVTDTGVVTLNAATAGGALLSALPLGDTPGAGAPVNSVNALNIDAHLSGGLIMMGGDANFTSSTTVGGSTGDTITGSATAGNVLGGSIGNDTITGTTSTTASDTVYTGGGADTITLAAGHTAVDHVELYAGNGALVGGVEGAVPNSIVTANDTPQLGWWNQGTGATGGAAQSATTNLGTATGFGTSADMSKVANFVAGAAPQDVVDISLGALGGHVHDAASGLLVAAGNAVFSTPVAAGGTVPAAAPAGVLVLSGDFTGAAGVASSLGGIGPIKFGTPLPAAAAGVSGDHIIVAYEDSGSNSVHIADLDLHSAAPIASTAGGGVTLAVSDMVQLTGVSVTALHGTAAASNIHFVA